MNYIIPESRLHQVIFKYLDMQNLNIVKRGVYVYFTENVDDEYAVLRCNIQNKRLSIFGGFVDKISNMFGIPVKDINQIIASWVEKTLGGEYIINKIILLLNSNSIKIK